ncbi:MAG: alpha-mannosidase [Lentisphaeria bacterium]|nr:alpha-mannosidase [Lentisphaeria bacterium]
MPDDAIHVVPSFHYDVVYLKGYEEYLAISFANIREALRILGASPDYTFLIEQVILLEAFWERCPECRDDLVRFAREGRLTVAPGMFVMPDMNHPDGESLFRQVKEGRDWLETHLGITPDCCWIADCWGHHAQLPQILTQAGYRTYVFWRCMRREVQRRHFVWEGLDGTRLRTHWLARGYGNVRFPSEAEVLHAPDLDLRGCGPQRIRALCEEIRAYGPGPVLLCNGGDFMMPQASAPRVVAALNAEGSLPTVRFSTPSAYADAVDWSEAPLVQGEFNSNFQGTFTSNIAIKQRARAGIGRALDLEALEALGAGNTPALPRAWRLLLKQQFHDTICGTVCDEALAEVRAELDRAEAELSRAAEDLAAGGSGGPCWFNGLGFAREECVEEDGALFRVGVGPFGLCRADEARRLPDPVPAALPLRVETPSCHVEIGESGYIRGLWDAAGRNLVAPDPCPFGALALQMDYGDLWLNFESPLNGGGLESSLTRNVPDPYDRSRPGDLANRGTFRPAVKGVSACRRGDVIEVVQTGHIGFWRLQIRFETRLRIAPWFPRIAFRTTLFPQGRHCRIRAAFPTALRNAALRHEIPYGIQARPQGEHVAQNWADLQDATAGVALLNRGVPGNGADNGTLLLTLFRAAAMEYKAPSQGSFNEGMPHAFDYAILVHGADSDAAIVREGHAFARPPLRLRAAPETLRHGWRLDAGGTFVSALRPAPEGVFVRLYEAVGRGTTGVLHLPPGFREYAPADGLERPSGEFTACDGRIPVALRPFEIRGLIAR